MAAAITAEPVGNYRYLDNITIRWLVGLLADIVAENVLNKHDAAEQWLFNAELWLARDAEGKPRSNLTPYDLVLRNHPRYLARSDNWTDRQDLEAEREPPAEWRKTLLTIGLSFPPVDFSQTVSESETPPPRRIISRPHADYDDLQPTIPSQSPADFSTVPLIQRKLRSFERKYTPTSDLPLADSLAYPADATSESVEPSPQIGLATRPSELHRAQPRTQRKQILEEWKAESSRTSCPYTPEDVRYRKWHQDHPDYSGL